MTPAERLELLRGRAPALAREYPFEPRALETPWGPLAYVDEGPRDGAPILCLHGNPTWSFLFRKVLTTFSDEHRVVAPDHTGCGLSARPAEFPYTLEEHAKQVERLVLDLDLRDITLLVHDWGGAIGMAFARRRPERVARLVVTNTAAFPGGRIPLRIAACRVPVLGPAGVLGLNLFARAAAHMTTVRPLTDELRRCYLAPYATRAERLATLRFVQDIPRDPRHPSYAELEQTGAALAQFQDRPTCLIWGERDWCFTPAFRAEWQRRMPHAEVHALPDAAHYLFEDAWPEIQEHLAGFLERHPLRAHSEAAP